MSKQDARLQRAIVETKEHLNLNRQRDDNEDFNDNDALEELLGECGKQRDGSCLYAGSEMCDWECPFS